MSPTLYHIVYNTLQTEYGYSTIVLNPQGTEHFRYVYKVYTDKGEYTLRLFPKDKPRSRVLANVAVLEFLQRYNFPAVRIIKDRSGAAMFKAEDNWGIVTTFIQGYHPELNRESMQEIGALLAQMHILYHKEPYPFASSLSVKKEREILVVAIESDKLIAVDDPNGIQRKVLNSLSRLPDFSQLPPGIIHSDIHRRNIIKQKDAAYAFIDLDEAGTGPAILDIGHMLSHGCIRFSDINSTMPIWKAEWAYAFIKGYQTKRELSSAEKQHIIYAAQFAALDYTVQYWVPRIDHQNWMRFQFLKRYHRDIASQLF